MTTRVPARPISQSPLARCDRHPRHGSLSSRRSCCRTATPTRPLDRRPYTARTIAGNATGISIFSRNSLFASDRPVTGVSRGTFVLRDSQALGSFPPRSATTARRLATLPPQRRIAPEQPLSGCALGQHSRCIRYLVARDHMVIQNGVSQPSAGVRFSPWRDVLFTPDRRGGYPH